MSDSPYETALTEARNALRQQSADLERVRNRTMVLLVFGFAAALVADHIAGYAVLAVLFVVALEAHWPRKVTFVQNGQTLVGWAESGANAEDARRDLALHMSRHYEQNEPKVTLCYWLYRAAWALLGAHITVLGFVEVG